jgi:hypothetical protein
MLQRLVQGKRHPAVEQREKMQEQLLQQRAAALLVDCLLTKRQSAAICQHQEFHRETVLQMD